MIDMYAAAERLVRKKEAITTLEVEEIAEELLKLKADYEELQEQIDQIKGATLNELVSFHIKSRKSLINAEIPPSMEYWQGRAEMASSIFGYLEED